MACRGEAAVEMHTCSVVVVLPGEVCACAAMAIVEGAGGRQRRVGWL